ncbi:rhodanese-related sulfurtransferase [Candidatus Woesearchaeota archaeon]|nr:rhodanese-related sulfurtransferase [Candidatus Woesearchaeota archaeon]
MYKVITFYKFITLDAEKTKGIFHDKCKELGILGRILIGNEGINAGVSGKIDDIEKFKKWVNSQPEFKDMTYRDLNTEKNAYHKLVVRTRKEIVAIGKDVDMDKKAPYISVDELNKLYENDDEFIIIDTRNDYEAEVGRFRNAKIMPIKTFKEFPKEISGMKDELKGKKIITYCTGGIRCEKATAYMKNIGIDNVMQLKGGIIEYMNKYPNKYWEGGLFVFDDRLVTTTESPLTECKHCGKKCGKYINCHNMDCDNLFICCDDCRKKMNSCCCEECKSSPRQRKKKYIPIGRVENYYQKLGIACVNMDEPLKKGMQIKIKGKTTDIDAIAENLRDDAGNAIDEGIGVITFPVKDKVRKNDQLMISP